MKSISSSCLYTSCPEFVLLRLLSENNRTQSLGVSRCWKEAKKCLQEAESRGEFLYVLFTLADELNEIVCFARLTNIVVSAAKSKGRKIEDLKEEWGWELKIESREHAQGSSALYFTGLSVIPKPRPLKEELVVVSTGLKIPEYYKWPYVICETPDWLEDLVNSSQSA